MTDLVTNKQLAAVIAEATGCTKAQSRLAMDRLCHTIAQRVTAGDRVRLDHLGSFTARMVKERQHMIGLKTAKGGPGLRTIPAHRRPKFQAHTSLKEALRGS